MSAENLISYWPLSGKFTPLQINCFLPEASAGAPGIIGDIEFLFI